MMINRMDEAFKTKMAFYDYDEEGLLEHGI
jgi:hypothetical protein